ncbi:MAG: hypothetical protein U9R79_00010 [Armatimonadota bacterium]|nr:hypothetical protein [Armatimonadota bacterium]
MLLAAALGLVTYLSIFLSVASARSNAGAARSAVLAAIAALEQAGPAPEAQVEGEEPSAADLASITKVALDYVRAIDDQDWEAGWALVHPQSSGDMAMDQWAPVQIAGRERPEEYYGWPARMMQLLPVLMQGAEVDLGEIVTREMSGWAELSIHRDFTWTLVLRRLGDGWAVDLAETRQHQARQAVERQLEPMTAEGSQREQWMTQMMAMMEPGMGGSFSPIDLALSEEIKADYEVADCGISGDRATVKLAGTVRLRMAMPLANGERGWSLAWCEEPKVLGPDESFQAAVAGRLEEQQETEECRGHVQQLMVGMLMYAADYDERLPVASSWCSAVHPYVGSRVVYHCPADDADFSYAFNYKLSRHSLAEAQRGWGTIALYESEIGKGNAFDWPDFPGASEPDPPRHGTLNVYGFLDGHAEAYSPDSCAIGEDAYRLPKPEEMGAPREPMMIEMPPPEPPAEE